MTPRAQGATRRIRVVAALLIAGLAAGPAASHLYWLLGGTWGLYTHGVRDEVATTGVRVVSAVVVVLLVARGVGRPRAGRVVAAGVCVRPDDSVLRLGVGSGLRARDARGLHLE